MFKETDMTLAKKNRRPHLRRKAWKQSMAAMLVMALLITMVPMAPGSNWQAYGADELSAKVETPVLVVTGEGILGGDSYTPANVGNEKSYTLDELKGFNEVDYLYSSLNSVGTKRIYKAKGIKVSDLFEGTALTEENFNEYPVKAVASDGVVATFNPEHIGNTTGGAQSGAPPVSQGFGVVRQYFPGIKTDDMSGASEVPAILSYENKYEDAPTIPTGVVADDRAPRLIIGQLEIDDVNNPMFNQSVRKIEVGDAITETAITIDGKAKTRAEILLMGRADRSYTYSTQGVDKTEYVRGVPLATLLSGYDPDSIVNFSAADGFAVDASGKTIGDIIGSNYILAYEKGSDKGSLTAVYDTAKNDPTTYGFFVLYGDGDKPAKLINNITVTSASGIDFVNSPYKHITNGGIKGQKGPYDVDAITGATLTIEGPGVKTSVPLPIRELEGQNAGAHRGEYTDVRDGDSWTLNYEGIRLKHIINDMTAGDNGIHKTDKAYRVLLKNRVRSTIAQFTLAQLDEAEAAGKPIIIAYGTGTLDGSREAPFVFDGGSGAFNEIDNEDGPIKLVYDKTVFDADPNPSYKEFGNVAYIYVAEEDNPGYKHNVSPYDTPENSEYVLTITGDKIGREVNYTVKELEGMVEYDAAGAPIDGGMGYRDEYSLANSNYWYVNEYEGVQLWKLLQKSGLAADAATGSLKDTLVSFSATDNYKDFDKFTIAQIADPDQFHYYEKNPEDLDDGEYKGDDAVDRRNSGYPVLVAYGVNAYPYVISNKLDGYLSGLSNDGGPLRIISGKMEYGHANGSKQAKLLDKVIVGEDKFYSTHKYNPNKNGIYQGIAEDSTIQVKVISGAAEDGDILKEVTYKVGDLEEILYGGSLTTAQLKNAKIKDFYELSKSSTFYNDLYEGLNLSYFLQNVVQLPGYKGTITFGNGSGSLKMGLEEVLAFSGYNGTTKLSGLAPVLAYAKNGSPMVSGKNEADGYEGEVTLAEGTGYEHKITVKNDGGPLAIIFPRESEDSTTASSLTSVNTITINLSPDNYAHTKAPYNSLENNTITVSGEGTRLTGPKAFTVSEIESKQTLAVTGDYNVKTSTGTQSQTRYRGIPLYNFLSLTEIGLKPNADKVKVICSDDTEYIFDLSEVYKSNYINGQNTSINNLKMILAYGSASVENPDIEDGLPLVKSKNEADGYVEEYGNSGGPIRLVVGQIDADDVNSGKILKDVIAIEVSASEMVSWNHSTSPVYQQYLDYELELKVVGEDNSELFKKYYTLEELESMVSLIERENITWVGTQTWEGINMWQFVLNEAASVPGIEDPALVTAFAEDGFSKELRSIFGMDGLQNGIIDGTKRIPIIIAYAHSGYPLVPSNTSDGYTAMVDNGYGPLRLMTHNNQGACLKNTNKIVVKVGGGGSDPQPVEEKDFNIYGLDAGTVAMDIRAIKNISTGDGKTVADYTSKGVTDKVKGAYLKDLLTAAGVSGDSARVSIVTSDGYQPDHYKDLTLAEIEEKAYMVAYDISLDEGSSWNGFSDADKQDPPRISTVRIYRNYDDGATSWFNKLTNIKGVRITGSGGGTDPEPGVTVLDPPFTIKGWGNSDITYGIGGSNGIKNLTTGSGGKATGSYSYTSDEVLVTDTVVGIKLIDLLTHGGITGGNVRIAINTTDGYKDKAGSYENLSLAEIAAKDYFVAYDRNDGKIADVDKNNVQASLRIYRNFDDGSTWKNCVTNVSGITAVEPFTVYPGDGALGNLPLSGVRSVWVDKNDGIWVGTYGGGVGYKAANADTFTIYNTATLPELETSVISAVAVDSGGGVWMTQNASYTNPGDNKGLVYMKNGVITKYRASDLPKTIPDDYAQEIKIDSSGNVWFGSFGGLTKYDPANGSWTTWGQDYNDAKGNSFPALSVDNITFDGKGGLWLGFYPTGAGTEADPFVGGFAHMDKNGNITPYKFTADYDSGLGSSLLAQVWVRDIAVDPNGGAWIIASGSYGDLVNDGGTVWYVDANKQAHKFKGKELLGAGRLSGNNELRTAAIDPDGGLWLGSSGDGIFYVDDPVNGAPQNIKTNYSGTLGHWPGGSSWNNIYSLDFVGSTLYAGSSSGLVSKTFTFDQQGSDPGGGSDIPEKYDIKITGGGVDKDRYYTIAQLKSAKGVVKLSKSYPWLNSYGSTGTDTFEGVYLDNLLEDVVGLNSKAKSVTVAAVDGYNRSFNLDSEPLGVYWNDITGNKIMLAWKKNGKDTDLQIVVGQKDNEHVNKPLWVSEIATITVNTRTETPGSGTPGNYEGSQGGTEGGEGTAPSELPVTQEVKAEIKPQTTIQGQTSASQVTTAEVNRALEQLGIAKKLLGEDGENAKGLIEIDANSGSPENIKESVVNLPLAALASISDEASVSAVIKTDLATITLEPEILAQLANQTGSNVSITIEIADESKLSDEDKALAGDRPILDIRIAIDGKEISSFDGRTIKAAIPYEASSGENEGNLIVIYLDGPDKGKPVKLSIYNKETKEMLVRTKHLSLYGITYKDVNFSDIGNHWAGEGIKFLANRDILKGKGANLFDPDGSVTRAEFVTMLANSVDGIEVAGSKSAGFDDIDAGAWFADYVNWAVSKGIVSGYGDGKFGPNDKITREQMALMTDNFIKAMAIIPDVVKAKADFADKGLISGWSAAAVTKMQQYGIINGNPDGTFAPKDTATRAQAAIILKSYIESILK